MSSSLDAAVADLARSQHGAVAVAQLLALGLSHKAIANRVQRGRWSRLHRNVVRIAGLPVTWESQVMAQVLAAGEGAVASHRTAAALWSLDGCRRGRPEITIPTGRWHRRTDIRVHRSTDIDRVRPVRRSGIPTTPVERTLLDLGAVVRQDVVLLAIDDARRRRLTDWDRLLDCLVLHARRGRDGVGTLRAILDEHIDEIRTTDSGFERMVFVLLQDAGLPAPTLQYEVVLEGRVYRLDLAYPDARLGIELDGSDHLRRAVWESDHVRQNALLLAGWTILRFTWRDYEERRLHIVREVRQALRNLVS